ncbi:hypothetical protein EC991_009107 [Linnemannia zychae]|nr:hypothetical protein EC991_009107 [Linnemannia zychae]
MAGLSLPGSNPAISSRGAASFVPRKLSTAVAIEPNNDDDESPYSSRSAQPRSQHDPRFGRDPMATSRSSGSGSFIAGDGGPASHPAVIPTVVPSSSDDDDGSTTTKTTTQSKEPSPTQHHTKPSTSSWRFPTTKGSFSHFSGNNPPNPLEPIQTWPSTANALSELYKSLHQINSTRKTTAERSSALHQALLNYNYLSRLQSMYDTILIPRRHTRTLFLLQGREPKTRDNLEQLLWITKDLIWLNEKERQKKRRSPSSSAKLDSAAGIAVTHSTASTPPTKPASDTYPHLYNPADDYHGLRVSEYTILMNWIGSVTNTFGTGSSPTDLSPHSSATTLSTPRSGAPQPYQHPISQSGPVDKAWAIWQDFLLTGMKPDIVLYTMLMDTLLKAKEFGRADQIWNHLQHQDSTSGNNRGKVVGLEAMESVPRSFNFGGTATNAATAVGLSNTSSGSSLRSKKHSDTSSPNVGSVVPNLQTLSVLMQSHIQQSNIEGVTRTYKQLQQTTLSQGQQRPINTVLVNQILKVLIDLGETDAAREIFSNMRADGSGDILGASASSTEKPTSSTATLITPIHHQTSRRRASWKREIRKMQSASETETASSTTATISTTGTGKGLSILPNETTFRLMLQVARREMDSELESQVLNDLRRCLSVPSSAEVE